MKSSNNSQSKSGGSAFDFCNVGVKAPVDTQMVYLLIKGPSYRGLDFGAREKVRETLRKQLETHGIRFVEYGWVWDEEDRCLLVVGQYAHTDDSSLWRNALETMGFEICIRTHLPGDEL